MMDTLEEQHYHHSTLQQREAKTGKIENHHHLEPTTMMETTEQQPSLKRLRENYKKSHLSIHKIEAYDALELLDTNGDIVKNMPYMYSHTLLWGHYRCIFYFDEEDKLYIVEEDTHWITCIVEMDELSPTMIKLIDLNLWPVIINKGQAYIKMVDCHNRVLTPYKNLHEWEIVKCGPFGIYRLVPRKGSAATIEEEERQKEKESMIPIIQQESHRYNTYDANAYVAKDLRHCKGKLEMFPKHLDIFKAPLWEMTPYSHKLFIVGVSVADEEEIYFIVVTDSHARGEYQVCLLEDTLRQGDHGIFGKNHRYYKDLWSMLNTSENVNAKILFGDYVFEVTFDGSKNQDWFDKKSLKVLELSEVPFYGKRLENYVFK